MKPIFSALVLAIATFGSGCAIINPDRSRAFEHDDLQLFAYDLGRTHAGLARCSGIPPELLDAHLESARIALQGQVRGRLAELAPIFEKGLRESDGPGHRLHIPCDCARELTEESRRHNLKLYREVSLPLAFDAASSHAELR